MNIELLKHALTMSAIAAFIYSMIELLWRRYRIKKLEIRFLGCVYFFHNVCSV